MIVKYSLSFNQPQHRFIDVIVRIPAEKRKSVEVQLPAWRPGRYELGNFAKNVRRFAVTNEQGHALPFEKQNKDSWKILVSGSEEIVVSYQYFSGDLNAGSTFVDATQLYVNPVNCLIYDKERMNEGCEVLINVPAGWQLACGCKWHQESTEQGKNAFRLFPMDFHELADSPFISSAELRHNDFTVEGTTFNIWIQGECRPDWERIIAHFSAFAKSQIEAYGEFPVQSYHFLLQVLPVNFYHGVEHLTSSVNALGPGYELMRERYDDLLGLCSHELYHAWNIKSIRPVEMFPYDYSKENYFKTGYVAEGVTTYMGDYFLHASGVFNLAAYFSELSAQLQKHMDNFGRRNYSVADSSFDTWLDGYVPGVAERKVSIYTEGCLLAFIADVEIMRHSKNKHRLHDVMYDLYHDYSKKGLGYSAKDYRKLVEKYAGNGMCSYFDTLINGTGDYLPMLNNALEYLGWAVLSSDPPSVAERLYGMKISDSPAGSFLMQLHPDEPVALSGMAQGDKLISVNGYLVNNDANKWIAYFGGENMQIAVLRGSRMLDFSISPAINGGFRTWRIIKADSQTPAQEENYRNWATVKSKIK